MGEVYRGRDTRLNRIVAIKIVSSHLASDPRFRERFELEAHTISQLNHPNICTLFDVGREDDKPFLVMEFVKGETLAARVGNGALPVADALEFGQQMAQALAHAHRQGIVHRDIKPANVIITDSGTVKILDFGLAKSNEPSTATQTGIAVGTLAYMAPEQLLTGGLIGPATDVWALGVVLFEMLTGERPFRGRDAIDVFKSILNDSPQLHDKQKSGIPRATSRIVATCLEKSSERRFPSAVELADALTGSRQPSTYATGRVAPGRRVNWWAAALIALVVVTVGALGARTLLQQRREQWARQEALPEIERLLNQDQYAAAFTLARQVQPVLGSDPVLTRVMPLISVPASFTTEPGEAEASFKPYGDVEAPWEPLGKTPLSKIRLPRGAFRFRFEKEGYATRYLARTLTAELEPEPVVLSPQDEMVRVPGGALPVNLSGFNSDDLVALGPFEIDRTEVTNRAYKEFVDANGYATPRYWRGRDVMSRQLVDSTGHAGPSTWEVGGYPSGRDEEPVGGVSWYEADAYCAFRGKQLPTVFHWARAALSPREIIAPLGPSIVPLSNFAGGGPAPVGSFMGLGPYGTSDFAGNVREWNWNGASSGRRWILGGAWNDPNYMFSVPFSQPAEDRTAENGFRCMRPGEPVSDALLAPIDLSASDYRGARPVSDEIFRIFAAQFAYVGSAAPATAEPIGKTPGGTKRERVEISAGYDNERLTVYLFMPDGAESVAPPYQAVLYFPALSAFQSQDAEHDVLPGRIHPAQWAGAGDAGVQGLVRAVRFRPGVDRRGVSPRRAPAAAAVAPGPGPDPRLPGDPRRHRHVAARLLWPQFRGVDAASAACPRAAVQGGDSAQRRLHLPAHAGGNGRGQLRLAAAHPDPDAERPPRLRHAARDVAEAALRPAGNPVGRKAACGVRRRPRSAAAQPDRARDARLAGPLPRGRLPGAIAGALGTCDSPAQRGVVASLDLRPGIAARTGGKSAESIALGRRSRYDHRPAVLPFAEHFSPAVSRPGSPDHR